MKQKLLNLLESTIVYTASTTLIIAIWIELSIYIGYQKLEQLQP